MQVIASIEIPRNSKQVSTRTDITHSGLSRFLHHVAELASESEASFAIGDGDLSAQNRSADLRPRQAGYETDFALLVRQHVAELRHAEEFRDVVRGDRD